MGRRARQSRIKRSRRLRRLVAIVLASVALICTSLAAALLVTGLAGSPRPLKTAAIVDQLSERDPNPAFAATVTEMLKAAGYVVDYYPGEEITVGFYRVLPTHGHDLIVLRSHSARLRKVWQGELLDEVVIFTTEPYDLTSYRDQRGRERLAKVSYHKGGNEYFAPR